MKNLQVKKQINNKLKLYRTGQWSEALVISGGLLGINFGYQGITKQFLASNFEIEKFMLLFGVQVIINILVLYFSVQHIKKIQPYDEIELLELLKKELKNGVNRFEKINEEDFEIEFAKYKKKYIENKVK